MNALYKATQYYLAFARGLNFIAPLLDLILRLWVAKVFFQSGLVKIQSWDSTLMLFEHEYQVPILSPVLSAWLGTGAELFLPVLLFLGLLSRPTALALFIFNIVAVTSYPDISAAGIKDHMIWGLMLAVTFIHGPGNISIDYWLFKHYQSVNRQ
ncbi:MAG: DoxX family protein [Gammaproteobacteria bacterium]|nr:DoxX family protein [Gammaproteobacteria bacterium]